VNNALKRVLERAGIPKVRIHDLRHTFATIALQNGVDIKTVSGMLGHFSAGFTLDIYAHVTTTAQKEAAHSEHINSALQTIEKPGTNNASPQASLSDFSPDFPALEPRK